MKKYLKLMRVKHYIKNLLIFLAIIFSCNISNLKLLNTNILNFIAFCLLSSTIYIFNDICDKDKDKKHPVKKDRPLVKEEISIKSAYMLILASIINFIPIFFNREYPTFVSYSILFSYLIINIFYSLKLKNIPILDVSILTFGFILRVIYGAICINIKISSWLYLTVMSLCFFVSLGKRKNEYLNNGIKARKVLAKYNLDYLKFLINTFYTAMIIFYSLWAASMNSNWFLISIIIIIFILMRYLLVMNTALYDDPVDIVLNDNILLLSIIIYAIYMGVILYVI